MQGTGQGRMEPMGRWLWTIAAMLGPLGGAMADPKVSQDEILAAVRRGEMRPRAQIEEAVRGRLPGEVIKVEIERDEGVWIYEFKTLDGRGRRHDVYVDAKTGVIVEIKRK